MYAWTSEGLAFGKLARIKEKRFSSELLVRSERLSIPHCSSPQSDNPCHQRIEWRQEFKDARTAFDAMEKDRRSAIVFFARQTFSLDVMKRTLDGFKQHFKVK